MKNEPKNELKNEPERPGTAGIIILIAVLFFAGAVALDVGGVQTKLGKALTFGPQKDAEPVTAPADAGPGQLNLPKLEVTQAWFLDAAGYEGGEAERKSTGAPMVVYFQKRGCETCRHVEHQILAAPEVKKILERAVKVRIDLGAGQPETKLAEKLGVYELPSLVTISPAGTPKIIPLERGGILFSATQVAGALK